MRVIYERRAFYSTAVDSVVASLPAFAPSRPVCPWCRTPRPAARLAAQPPRRRPGHDAGFGTLIPKSPRSIIATMARKASRRRGRRAVSTSCGRQPRAVSACHLPPLRHRTIRQPRCWHVRCAIDCLAVFGDLDSSGVVSPRSRRRTSRCRAARQARRRNSGSETSGRGSPRDRCRRMYRSRMIFILSVTSCALGVTISEIPWFPSGNHGGTAASREQSRTPITIGSRHDPIVVVVPRESGL